MKTTAFVSHYDCSRHDTGWGHPDHQGRLPALMRAVYRDMLTLHEPLLEVEGRHATVDELRLVHDPEYIERVRGWAESAAVAREVIEPVPGIRVSGATWDAATAAVGSALTGVDAVLEGRVRNAFCAARPPGQDAGADRPGGFAVFDAAAVAAEYLVRSCGVGPVLVVVWGGKGASTLRELLARSPEVDLVGVYEAPGAGRGVHLPPGAGGEEVTTALQRELEEWTSNREPAFVVLSADFSGAAEDPVGSWALRPADYYDATRIVRELADSRCNGRLVSVLEGGYDAESLGRAAVEHLRALAGLPSASG